MKNRGRPKGDHETIRTVVRIWTLIHLWLADCAKEYRHANPSVKRWGIATEINQHLLSAFKADPRNKDKLHLLK